MTCNEPIHHFAGSATLTMAPEVRRPELVTEEPRNSHTRLESAGILLFAGPKSAGHYTYSYCRIRRG